MIWVKTEMAGATQLKPYQFKPGQSGNPAGPPKGYRKRLSEDFLSDVHDAWQIYGKTALVKTAKNEPSVFVRVVAQLMPKDIEITINITRAERLSDDELAGYLEAPDRNDTIEAASDTQVLQPLGEEM